MAASAVAFALLRLPLYPLLLRATRYPPLSAPCSLLSILCCCWPRGGHWCIAFWSGQIIARIILCHILKPNEFVASSAPSSLLFSSLLLLFSLLLLLLCPRTFVLLLHVEFFWSGQCAKRLIALREAASRGEASAHCLHFPSFNEFFLLFALVAHS